MSKKKSKGIPLYIQIIIGIVLGLLWGLTVPSFSWGIDFTLDYIKPVGTIFLRLLMVLAIPLVITSLITGVASLKDLSRLKQIGIRTIGLFMITAFTATTLGIVLVNIIQPGKSLPEEMRKEMVEAYELNKQYSSENGLAQKDDSKGKLAPLAELIPDNIFAAASNNRSMIQVVFFVLLFAIALTQIPSTKTEIVVRFFDGLNEIFIKLVTLIMYFAPIGVFALMGSAIIQIAKDNPFHLISALFWYVVTVLIGLFIILFLLYPLIFRLFSKIGYGQFFKGMRPALLLAFSSSSSSATLPVTIERVEKHLGVSKEVAGFVLPFGTTINMDGTAIYQCIAAVFLAQVYGLDLTIFQQVVIILTATLGAVGAAGIPSAGIVTLTMVLQSVGIPLEGLVLILAPDRILDMFRTVINVAGDATAAVVIASHDKK
ncbi:MAG TPA: dicarboxylate/amino acid:cation symporter [Cytophagaceae bacterium]